MIQWIHGYDPAYEAFLASSPKGHLFQSYLWSGVKKNWGWLGAASLDGGGRIRGAVSLLIRRLPALPYPLLYAPRGPVCDFGDRETLDELLGAVREEARRRRAYVVKLDPDVTEAGSGALAAAMEAAGFVLLPENRAFGHIQPQYVVRLALNGRTPEELLAAFRGKTRYNIGLAARKGVEVRVCGPEALDDFQALMRETGARDGFGIRPEAYFSNLLSALGAHARLYMAYRQSVPLAGAVALQYGDKTWYLYGASASEHRELMPNYLLQWRMIGWALEAGCAVYDFRGVSGRTDPDDPLGGLWRFKSGWGAERTRFVGEYDCVLRPLVNALADRAIPAARRLFPARQSR